MEFIERLQLKQVALLPLTSQLVIQAGVMAKGGDVFALDMGELIKFVSLANKMINLSGLTDKTIQITTVLLKLNFQVYTRVRN